MQCGMLSNGFLLNFVREILQVYDVLAIWLFSFRLYKQGMLMGQAGSSKHYYYLKIVTWMLLLCLSLFFFLSSFYCMQGMLASLAAFP